MWSAILLLGLFLLLGENLPVTIWPSTTCPLISSQFATLNGYGLSLRTERLSLSYYKSTYNSHEPGELLQPGDNDSWVYSRKVDLWQINYSFYRNKGFAVGLGLNKAESEKPGWQIYAENNFYNFAFVKLGFRRIWMEKPIDALVVSFGIDIFEIVSSGLIHQTI